MLFLIKSIVSIVAVIGLSLVVEYAGPRVAGVLSGFPTGLAIALFFYGYEVSPQFAADSGIYTLVGLIASQTFVYAYYRASSYFRRWNILLSSICATLAYLLVAWVLHLFHFSVFLAVALPIASIFLFYRLFQSIPNTSMEKRIDINFRVILLRALCAASLILVVTGIAKLVGSTWAGLFSAFPVNLFPLLVIIHFTYGSRYVHTIIKNFPLGIGSLIVYALSVFFFYPLLGIATGTLLAFAAAILYLVVFSLAWKAMHTASAVKS